MKLRRFLALIVGLFLAQSATAATVGANAARTIAGQAVCADAAVSAARAVFYVSPQGRDDWSGRLARPNRQRTDGPFASIEAARDAVRVTGIPGTIVVGGGDYYLTRPVVFGPQDAGLSIVAACGETPTLYGGPLVRNWTAGSDGRWIARLALPEDEQVGDIFVDGIVQTEARYPNAPADGDPRKGWLFAASPGAGVSPWLGNTRFRFHPGDIPAWKDTNGLVAHIVGGAQPGSQWGNDTLPVVSIDWATGTIETKGTGYFFTSEGSRYFLSGAEALLDAPHEWWFDAATGRLEYIPAGRSFRAATVVAGVLPTFFRLKGADGMVIAGLTFRDGAPQGSGKYGTDTRGFGAIRLEHADRVSLLGNIIENVGVGIHVAESTDVLIAGNEIAHVAGNGIYLGTVYGSFGKSSGARIVANRIFDVGRVYIETAGIWFQAADHVRIAHNVIADTAQFGIAGGSIWGKQDAVYDAVIEYNEIRNANQKTADGGAIKMMGAQGDLQNTVIRGNFITGTGELMNRPDGTFWPPGYENTREWPSPISWAIYTDGRASGIRIDGNVLSGNIAAIGINGGWNNVVTRNVITQGSGAAFRVDDATGRDWHPSWAQPNRIEDNIVSIDSRSGRAVSVYAPGHGVGYVTFTRNRYEGNLNGQSFQMEPEIMPSGQFGSLSAFQKAGQESGSLIVEAAGRDGAATGNNRPSP